MLQDLAKHFVREYDNKSVGGFHVSKDDDAEGTLQAIVSSVILVGGSSKLRSVQRLLRDYFGDIIFVDEDTPLCVSKGAMEAMFMIDDPLKSVREVLFHALVVKADGKAIGTVPRGTSIPFATQWCARQQRNGRRSRWRSTRWTRSRRRRRRRCWWRARCRWSGRSRRCSRTCRRRWT